MEQKLFIEDLVFEKIELEIYRVYLNMANE